MGLALAMTAFAQTEDAPPDGEAASAEAADPCAAPPIDAANDAPVDPDQAPPEPDKEQDELGRLGADGLPCPPLETPVDAVPKPPADGNQDGGPDENPQPEPPAAGKAEDFEPDEEISEDYPVPLPSDI